MVLTSQVPRETSSRRYMSRRRRSRWPLWLWLAAVVALGLLLLWYIGWLSWSGAAEEETGALIPPTAEVSPVNGAVDEGGSSTVPVTQAAPRVQHTTAAAERRDAASARPTWTPAATVKIEKKASPPAPILTPTLSESRGGASEASGTQATTSPRPAKTPAPVARRLDEAVKMVEAGQLVEGRAALSQLIFNEAAPLSAADAQRGRDAAVKANEQLIWSKEVVEGDPLVEVYVVQAGDLLGSIARRFGVPYPFLEDINRTPANRMRAGQRLKVIRGPFHAIVSKSEFRMDLYLTSPEGENIYAASFPVGLGEGDSTPPGLWRIARGSKVTNPDWRNPRTGKYYKATDPDNPIGERWMKLEGLDDTTRDKDGYGIHGTIDPSSIGRQASMGCIRLNDEGIARVFELLQDGASTVRVVP